MDRARAVPELAPDESQTRVKATAPDLSTGTPAGGSADDEHERPTLVPASDALEARVLFETRAAIERRLAIGEEHRPTRRIAAKHTLKGLVAPRRQVLPTPAAAPVEVHVEAPVAAPVATPGPRPSPRAGRRVGLWLAAFALVLVACAAYAYRDLLARVVVSLFGT